MADFTPCPRCVFAVDSDCCDVDEVTGVCSGRCDENGKHPHERPPIVAQVDAMRVARWMQTCADGATEGSMFVSSHAWWNVREADKAGVGAIIDCLRQLEHEEKKAVTDA